MRLLDILARQAADLIEQKHAEEGLRSREALEQGDPRAFGELMQNRDRLMFMLKTWATCDDEEIRRSVRADWRNLVDLYGAADILVAEVQLQRAYPGGPARGARPRKRCCFPKCRRASTPMASATIATAAMVSVCQTSADT